MKNRMVLVAGVLAFAGILGAAAGILGATALDGEAAAQGAEMLIQQFTPAAALAESATGMIAATSSDVCPDGWNRLWFDNTPLFMPLGMLTNESGSPADANGNLFSNFTVLVACIKK